MDLIIEKSVEGRRGHYIDKSELPVLPLPKHLQRASAPKLPQVAEGDICRHYSALESRTFGINDGFYPLGSCTMKHNPKINEQIAANPSFTGLHPLQPIESVQGLLEALAVTEHHLAAITGMEHISFQPAAGAHGELCCLMMFKKYFEQKGERRTKVLIPDSAHGTNPATVHMCGMKAINLPSNASGCVDMPSLKAALAANGDEVAGIMLTNPNTLGIFEQDIEEITRLVHEAGGLCFYDGANLNAIAGIMRPGDMGFDCVHLNLHKTFSTPHGGGGPGSGAIGCKAFLYDFLPGPLLVKDDKGYAFKAAHEQSIGRILGFYGNTLVILRALAYILSYGGDGLAEMSRAAVLNANYLKKRLEERFDVVNKGFCMHEFVISMDCEATSRGITAKDMAKAILDEGMMAPTIYFPLIVKEALMLEPTETEGKETLDKVADSYIELYDRAMADPKAFRQHPQNTVVGRPDEAVAARKPKVRW